MMRYVRFPLQCVLLWTILSPHIALGFVLQPARTGVMPRSSTTSRIMAYLKGYYEVGARNIQRRWGSDIARLQGLRLDRIMAAHYTHPDYLRTDWHEMEPLVLEFNDGTALSVHHTDFSKLTISVNQYNTTEDHDDKYDEDPHDRLDWLPLCNDEIIPLIGRTVDYVSFVVWIGNRPAPKTIHDMAYGMVALRLDLGPDSRLLISNGLDENRFDVGRISNATEWKGWYNVPQLPLDLTI